MTPNEMILQNVKDSIAAYRLVKDAVDDNPSAANLACLVEVEETLNSALHIREVYNAAQK